MKARITLVAVCTLLFLVGCSGPPSESKGRAALAQKIEGESKGLIRLVSFQKTDGVEQVVMGMKAYRMKYTAEIEFTDDCVWGDGGMMGWGGQFVAERPAVHATGALSQSTKYFKSGGKEQREQVFGTLTFQKTENGWSLYR
jgi:hypothetical protein